MNKSKKYLLIILNIIVILIGLGFILRNLVSSPLFNIGLAIIIIGISIILLTTD